MFKMQRRFQKKDVKEETLDELEQKTYMSYLSKSRGRIKSKPSVAKSRAMQSRRHQRFIRDYLVINNMKNR